jgi:DNA polymerase-3 subunit alpha
MAASLTSEVQNPDKIVKYIAECRDMGIEILPPDLDESQKSFAVVGNQIRFGLAAVKNVGDAAIDAILAEREGQGKFASLADFCRRVDLRKVNRRVIESLIKCGAFDFSKATRSQMLSRLDELLEQSQSDQKKRGEPQLSMWSTAETRQEDSYPDIEEFPEKQLIALEKETMGFYISRHPLARLQEEIKRVTNEDTSTLARRKNGGEVKVCGLVSELKEIVTKKGDRMAFLTLEDMKGFVEVILFPEVFRAALPVLNGGDPILVRGTVDPSEDHVKIKATEVQPLSEIPLPSQKNLRLKIPLASLMPSQLEGLKEILADHRGHTRVLLHLINGKQQETIIALSDQYAVDPSPRFQDRVRTLFQPSVIAIE